MLLKVDEAPVDLVGSSKIKSFVIFSVRDVTLLIHCKDSRRAVVNLYVF